MTSRAQKKHIKALKRKERNKAEKARAVERKSRKHLLAARQGASLMFADNVRTLKLLNAILLKHGPLEIDAGSFAKAKPAPPATEMDGPVMLVDVNEEAYKVKEESDEEEGVSGES